MFKIDSSLSFSSDLVRGVHWRSSVAQRSRERRETRVQPLPSLAFSHAHSNFQGVKITPLVGLIYLLTVELFFGGVIEISFGGAILKGV